MNIVEVNNKKLVQIFNQIPFTIYKNDPYWIPHLKQDVEFVFNSKKNKFFNHGQAKRWILFKDKMPIGRVAAFINYKQANNYKQPTGGMGFFECIKNKEAAFLLFDTCKNWLSQQNMQAMDGPINFGEKDKFWGLIKTNFSASPYYGQNYNPHYYIEFFEEYGFKVYYNQYIFYRSYRDKLQQKFIESAQNLSSDPNYTVKTINKNKLKVFAEDFRTVYNRAWKTHDNFKEMEWKQAMSILKKLKPIMDPDLMYFAYYNSKPIGFYIALPELNQCFRFVNGNLNWWGKLKFLYHKWKGTCYTSFGVAFGIDPDFQKKGVEGLIFKKLAETIQPTMKYDDMIITWIGDFNPKMIAIIEGLGATKFREMATYRYLFDRNAPFERAPIIT